MLFNGRLKLTDLPIIPAMNVLIGQYDYKGSMNKLENNKDYLSLMLHGGL